jgi:glutamine amidotransferase
MQLLFDEGDEFERTSGLGLVPGRVERLPIVDARAKLPHVSWNEILPAADGRWNGTVLETTKPNSDVYFVHSYCALPTNHSHVLASTCYGGISFCSAVQHQNISGFQFHPEKSGPVGLAILKQFIDTCN